MNAPFAYRVDDASPDQHIKDDPFPEGKGVRLDLKGEMEPLDVCALVTELFGVPCSADSRGAWLDLSGSSLTAAGVRKIWTRRTSENRGAGRSEHREPDIVANRRNLGHGSDDDFPDAHPDRKASH